MKWLRDVVTRLPPDPVLRRALDESIADVAHETGRAPTRVLRVAVFARAALAVLRLLLGMVVTSAVSRPLMDAGRDMRFALRRLRGSPIFTIFSIVSLALAIGAATAVYSVVHVVMGPPPGVNEIDRVVDVYHSPRGSMPMVALSWPDFEDLRARQTLFDRLSAFRFSPFALSANGRTWTAVGEHVTGEYFQTIGVNARLGRSLLPADDDLSAPPVAVISHRVWQTVFESAPTAVGQVIRINGAAFQIVGVAPPEFTGLFNGGLIPTAAWVPMSEARQRQPAGLGTAFNPNARDQRWLLVRGRLAPGRTIDQANAEVAGIARGLDAEFPIGQDIEPRFRSPSDVRRPWGVRFLTSRMFGVPDSLAIGLVTAALIAVGLVVIIACTNLANLSLSRTSRRVHERAIRRALGASRWRLIREMLAETLLLTGVGGVLGLGVTRALMIVIATDVPLNRGIGLRVEPSLDLAVLVVAGLLTALALVVAGLVPALLSTRADMRSALAGDGAATSPRWRGRRYLIALQVTASVVLVTLASVYVRQIHDETVTNTGVDLDRLALLQIDFGSQRYEEARAGQITRNLLDQLRVQPNVEGVAALSGLPFGVTSPASRTVSAPENSSRAWIIAGTHDMFRTLGVTIVSGRGFDERDTRGSAPVIILSTSTAERLFGRTNVVGQDVRVTSGSAATAATNTLTVVGVAADTDVRQAGQRTEALAYLPLDQRSFPNLIVAARTSGDPAALVGTMRRALASVDPEVAVVQAGTGPALATPVNPFFQIAGGVSGILGSFALMLAVAGLYGVLSQVITARTREIGLRIALGADASAIQRTVLREGLSPVLIGLVAGMGLGAIARAAVQPAFVRLIPGLDPTILILVPALFIAAGLAAGYLPARRAARVDPNVALRSL